VQNVPTNPDIREMNSANTATGYYAENCPNPDYFIEGSVLTINGERVLTFIVLAIKAGPGGTIIRGRVRGSEFFDAMWAHFASKGTTIDVIQAEWTDTQLGATATFTTNLEAFNKAVMVHSSLDDAARAGTVTGKYAKKKGFTKANIIRALQSSLQGQTGAYKDVIVQFRRPEL
jgi:hypothetical protein